MISYDEMMNSLKSRILNSGLSLEQIAYGMDISVKTLKSYLSGKTKPRVRHIYKLCFVLNVNPNVLLGFEEDN